MHLFPLNLKGMSMQSKCSITCRSLNEILQHFNSEQILSLVAGICIHCMVSRCKAKREAWEPRIWIPPQAFRHKLSYTASFISYYPFKIPIQWAVFLCSFPESCFRSNLSGLYYPSPVILGILCLHKGFHPPFHTEALCRNTASQ